MTNDKIPVELASMVGDYAAINDVRKTPSTDGKERKEYWLLGTRMWSNAIEYLKEHNYEIIGVDRSTKTAQCQVRLWIRKTDD
jgi:hypothetical protein